MGLNTRQVRSDRVIRSGVYEFDLEAGELYRHGGKVALQEQPFRVLEHLLARPGALVTREALQTELWGEHPLIDAEQGLNTAIRKLRAAFRDNADSPRFIETVPKRGYRFIGPLQDPASPEPVLLGESSEPATFASVGVASEPPATTPYVLAHAPRQHRLALVCASLVLVGLGVVMAAGFSIGSIGTAAAVQAVPGPIGGPRRPDRGVGGFDLKSPRDQAISFDFDHSGKLDHLLFYRPGPGFVWILRHADGVFRPAYVGDGVGDYDLKAPADRILAFDYDHGGRRDYLAIYRPGAGVLRIIRNAGDGLFTPVYRGAAADDPAGAADQVLAFDYDHSGKLDHLLTYRPGKGIVDVSTNLAGRWSRVSASEAQVAGPATDRASVAAERALAFDYDHSGKLDHLLVYRPGEGLVTILKNAGGVFAPVLQARGLGGFDLRSTADQAVAVDFDRTGKLDHLLLYRPGSGQAVILKHSGATFSPVYQGHGLAGYDLMSVSDRALAFDFERSGRFDHVLLYRPGTGVARIVRFN